MTITWNVDRLNEVTTSAIDFEYCGRDLWCLRVGEGGVPSISIIDYWAIESDYEGGIHTDKGPNFPSATQFKIRRQIGLGSPYEDHQWNVGSITRVYDKCYVTIKADSGCESSKNILSIDINTYTATQIPHPFRNMKSHVESLCVNNKLWIVWKSQGGNDFMAYYDTVTSTWSDSIQLPGRQDSQRRLGWAHDEYVYVSSRNEGRFYKYNSSDMTQVGFEYVNLNMDVLQQSDDQKLLIGSQVGLISTYTEATDSLVHDLCSTENTIQGIEKDNQGYVWSIGPHLVRTKIGTYTDNIKFQADDSLNTHIGSFGGNSFVKMMRTPEFTYDVWDVDHFDTRTVKQYIWLIGSDDNLYFFRCGPLYRTNEYSIRATGMVSVGEGFIG